MDEVSKSVKGSCGEPRDSLEPCLASGNLARRLHDCNREFPKLIVSGGEVLTSTCKQHLIMNTHCTSISSKVTGYIDQGILRRYVATSPCTQTPQERGWMFGNVRASNFGTYKSFSIRAWAVRGAVHTNAVRMTSKRETCMLASEQSYRGLWT